MFDKVTEILDGYTEVRKEEMTPDMLLGQLFCHRF